MYNLSTEIIHQTSQSDVNRGGGGHTEIVKCRDDQTLRVWASENEEKNNDYENVTKCREFWCEFKTAIFF